MVLQMIICKYLPNDNDNKNRNDYSQKEILI